MITHVEDITSLVKINLKIKSGLSVYSDVYMHIERTITVANTSAADANNTSKKVIFKDFAPFTDCIRKINSTQDDNA